jgi:hypothetical protein
MSQRAIVQGLHSRRGPAQLFAHQVEYQATKATSRKWSPSFETTIRNLGRRNWDGGPANSIEEDDENDLDISEMDMVGPISDQIEDVL